MSFSLDRLARGHGLAGRLLSLGLDAMRHQWGQQMGVVAEVKSENLASARVFSIAGFRELASSNKACDALFRVPQLPEESVHDIILIGDRVVGPEAPPW